MLSKVGLLSGMLDTSPRLTIDAEPSEARKRANIQNSLSKRVIHIIRLIECKVFKL